MSEIKTTKTKITVGEVYRDIWNTDKVRVSLDEWGVNERMMSDGSLLDLISARGYELVEYGASGENDKIKKEIVKRSCTNCGSRPMYDTKQNAFYCPRCES